jgi:hypothetical protein
VWILKKYYDDAEEDAGGDDRLGWGGECKEKRWVLQLG